MYLPRSHDREHPSPQTDSSLTAVIVIASKDIPDFEAGTKIAEASDARVGGRRNLWTPGLATSLRVALGDLNFTRESKKVFKGLRPRRWICGRGKQYSSAIQKQSPSTRNRPSLSY
jgi:hypothetical protein